MKKSFIKILLLFFTITIISCKKDNSLPDKPENPSNPAPVSLLFEKNVLLEQYTGTWCGYCPRAVGQIEDLLKADSKVVHIALHLSDEMSYSSNASLFQSFGFTGVPTVHADRISVWTGNINTISSMHTPENLGLALNVTSSGTTVTANVRVKFGKQYFDALKLSVYLLTDNLSANQANYYNSDQSSKYYQKGSPITNFIHRNVMTKSGTDMFGEVIPASNTIYNGIYSKTIDFAGISSALIPNIRIVAFVAYGNGANNKRVINSIMASAGENKDFIQY
jgi:thiol-disulfide isomerase/thioredoxin